MLSKKGMISTRDKSSVAVAPTKTAKTIVTTRGYSKLYDQIQQNRMQAYAKRVKQKEIRRSNRLQEREAHINFMKDVQKPDDNNNNRNNPPDMFKTPARDSVFQKPTFENEVQKRPRKTRLDNAMALNRQTSHTPAHKEGRIPPKNVSFANANPSVREYDYEPIVRETTKKIFNCRDSFQKHSDSILAVVAGNSLSAQKDTDIFKVPKYISGKRSGRFLQIEAPSLNFTPMSKMNVFSPTPTPFWKKLADTPEGFSFEIPNFPVQNIQEASTRFQFSINVNPLFPNGSEFTRNSRSVKSDYEYDYSSSRYKRNVLIEPANGNLFLFYRRRSKFSPSWNKLPYYATTTFESVTAAVGERHFY